MIKSFFLSLMNIVSLHLFIMAKIDVYKEGGFL